MADAVEHERLGDLASPFAVTARHERAQQECERLRDAVRCNGAPLTYEAFEAGAPCPGCGRPYRDAEPWECRGTVDLNPEERARYDAEGERYAAMHGACRSYRHSVSGSSTTHCGRCCPVPPPSPAQIEGLRGILGKPTASHELMRWRLRLFCGHVVERQAHLTHRTVHAAFPGSVACPTCGLDPATITDGAALGVVDERESRAVFPPRRPQPSRAELEMKVQALEAEVERLRSEHS